jgi:hypothetical protein
MTRTHNTKKTYFAVLVTQSVHPIPSGLREPHGVFTSLEEAREYLIEAQERWNERAGNFPFFDIRINEYGTRKAARMADIGDGTESTTQAPLATHDGWR